VSERNRKLLKILVLAAIVVLLSWLAQPSRGDTASACCPNGSCPLPATQSDSSPYVVARIVNDLGPAKNYGSGTVVEHGGRKDIVLTCAHLFREGTGKITVTFSDGTKDYQTKVLGIDKQWELAALRLDRPRANAVAIAIVTPRPGDWAQSCGFGRDGRYWCNQGRVRGYVQAKGTPRAETLEITGPARQGDSGGPIFNRRRELVAVLWGTDGRVTGGTFCGRIRKFLRRVLGDPQRSAPPIVARPVVPVEPTPTPSPPPSQQPPLPPKETPAAQNNDGRFHKIEADLDGLGERLAGLGSRLDGLAQAASGAAADITGAGSTAAAITAAATALGFSAPPAALLWGGVVLLRRWRRKRQRKTPAKKEPAEPAAGFSLLPRRDEEAAQFLRLSMLEGRDPLHDALVGRLAYDEIQNIIDAKGPAAEWAAGLRRTLEARFNEMVPLSI